MRGRPKLPDGKAKAETIGVRVSPALKEALTEAATANGRSISREVEIRLERTFIEDRERQIAEDNIRLDQRVFLLNETDYAQFVRVLENAESLPTQQTPEEKD